MAVKKCLDTYALVEIANENPAFAEYVNVDFVITDLTMAEFFTVLLREEDEKVASYWFKKLKPYCVRFDVDVLVEAVKFRWAHRKQGISFFDAVGYLFALKNGMRFVTGDKEFEDFVGVEFRKK